MTKVSWTDHLQSKIYEDALNIRYQVFVEEQKVPAEIETMNRGQIASSCPTNRQPVGTARIYHRGDGIYKYNVLPS